MVHETVKMGADNPDNHYFNAQVSGKYEYRITGKRNTIHYLGFFTQNGNYGTTGGLAPCGQLEHTDLKVRDDGSFEIILSKTPKGENWLKIEDETGLVMVRQTFLDRIGGGPCRDADREPRRPDRTRSDHTGNGGRGVADGSHVRGRGYRCCSRSGRTDFRSTPTGCPSSIPRYQMLRAATRTSSITTATGNLRRMKRL